MIQLEDPWEHMVMRELIRCANAGELCPTVTHFAVLLDCSEGGTVVGIMKRLEARGLIHVTRYQKTRQVTILETGAQTAEPKSKAIHWRDRLPSAREMRQSHRKVRVNPVSIRDRPRVTGA